MTSKRLYLILIGCVCLLVVGLIGGTYGANTLLTSQAGKLVSLKARSAALAQEQLSLNKAKKDIATYSDLEKITKSVVPEDKDQAEAVREIVNIANANKVSLATISFPNSSLGNTATGAPVSTTTPAAGGSAASGAGALSQLLPVKNIPGVYALQINVISDSTNPVSYASFINFLSNLEHNRRTAQVNTISIQPDKDNSSSLSFTLGLNEYIKP